MLGRLSPWELLLGEAEGDNIMVRRRLMAPAVSPGHAALPSAAQALCILARTLL